MTFRAPEEANHPSRIVLASDRAAAGGPGGEIGCGSVPPHAWNGSPIYMGRARPTFPHRSASASAPVRSWMERTSRRRLRMALMASTAAEAADMVVMYGTLYWIAARRVA